MHAPAGTRGVGVRSGEKHSSRNRRRLVDLVVIVTASQLIRPRASTRRRSITRCPPHRSRSSSRRQRPSRQRPRDASRRRRERPRGVDGMGTIDGIADRRVDAAGAEWVTSSSSRTTATSDKPDWLRDRAGAQLFIAAIERRFSGIGFQTRSTRGQNQRSKKVSTRRKRTTNGRRASES